MVETFPTLDWPRLVAAGVSRRKQEALTQYELAEIAGVSQPTVWRFERGDRTIRLHSALAILEALGLLAETQPIEAEPRFVDYRNSVEFFVSEGEQGIRARIGRMALRKLFGWVEDDPLQGFHQNRKSIERIAYQKYLSGRLEPDGSIWIDGSETEKIITGVSRERVTEHQVGLAVLQALADQPTGSASFRHLRKLLPEFLKLSPDDRVPSPARPSEELWQQQVRNIVSHRNTPGNIIREGLAEYSPGRLAITPAGRQHLNVPEGVHRP